MNHKFWTGRQAHNFAMETCCLCFEGFGKSMGNLLVCCQCKIRVHHECYGQLSNSFHEQNSIFLCQRCEFVRRNDLRMCDVQCVFCPNTFGLIKKFHYQGDSNKTWWGHVLCINMLRQVYIETLDQVENKTTLQLVIWSSQQAFQKRSLTKCYICNSNKGFAIDCDHCQPQKCQSSFHATCGLKERLVYYHKGIVALFPSKQNVYNIYCKFHLMHKLLYNRNKKVKSKKIDDNVARNISKMVQYFKNEENKNMESFQNPNKMNKSVQGKKGRKSNINSSTQSSFKSPSKQNINQDKTQRAKPVKNNQTLFGRKGKRISMPSVEAIEKKINNLPLSIIQQSHNKKDHLSQNICNQPEPRLFELPSHHNPHLIQYQQNCKVQKKDTVIIVEIEKKKNIIIPRQNISQQSSLFNQSVIFLSNHFAQSTYQTHRGSNQKIKQQCLMKLDDSFQNESNILMQQLLQNVTYKQPEFNIEKNLVYFINETPRHELIPRDIHISKMSKILNKVTINAIQHSNQLEFYLTDWLTA